MNTNLHPTITQSLRPFMGSMGMFSASPTADAEDHFNMLADTFMVDVDYLGLKLSVEINQADNCIVDVLGEDGTCWYYELSEHALRKVLAMACEELAA